MNNKKISEDKIREIKTTLDFVYGSVSEHIGHNQGTFRGKSIDKTIQDYQQALQAMGNVQKALVSQVIIDIIQS